MQVIRGKRLLGELLVDADRVAYVQELDEEPEGEHLFELVSESETERAVACYFVLSHGFEEAEPSGHERSIH